MRSPSEEGTAKTTELDNRRQCVTIDTMPARTPITDILRQAIVDSGLPLLKVAEATGVERASISRFVHGERSLRLDIADRLATYFGLELQAKRKGK